MIGLDTNVWIRYLVEDDPEQSARAAERIEGALSAGEELFLSDPVLCEMVWVLARAYRFRKDEIAELLGTLLRTRHLNFQDSDRVGRALSSYREGKGDFSDHLIRESATDAGCSAVVTFDRALWGEGFSPP